MKPYNVATLQMLRSLQTDLLHLREIEAGANPISYDQSHLQAMAKVYGNQELMRVLWRDDTDFLRAASSFIDGWHKTLNSQAVNGMQKRDWLELLTALRQL